MIKLLPALMAAAALLAQPAHGAEATSPVLLAEPELASIRGGLMTPLGLEVGFAATIRTYVDDRLVLESRLAWTPEGLVTAGATSGAADALGLDGTEVRHLVDQDRIVSLVLNTADGRVIRQATDVTLSIPQLAAFQDQVAFDRLTSALHSALGLALRDQR